MKLSRVVGSTSEIWQLFIQDTSSTTGGGLAGLTFASGSLTCYYHRDTDTTATAVTLVTMTVGTFTSSGFKEIDGTNMAGCYQFCPPNAALATGAKSVVFMLKGATNMAPCVIEVDLDSQVDLMAINGNVDGPARLDRSARTIATGTVGIGSNTTSVVTSALSPVGAVADQFKGRILIFDKDTTTVNLRSQGSDITASTSAAAPTFTVTGLTTAPASGDTFIVA